jgi:hypothetical protein
MSKQPFQARARALARSGKFASWRAVVFELQFEPGYKEAMRWLSDPITQAELDDLCSHARARSKQSDPEAA